MDKIVIIGKKNVGKSSLFNILTKSNDSLVTSYAGYTRDSKSKPIKINSKIYTLTDTAGIGHEKEKIEILTLKNTWETIKNSNIILYVFEIKSEPDYIDINIIKTLKKLKKKIIFITNKIDLINNNIDQNLNTKLNQKSIKISVKKQIGIEKLIKKITELSTTKNKKKEKIHNYYKIAISGRPNVGKSSLINKITNSNKLLTYDEPGTTRDNININLKYKNTNITLIDTPGIKYKKHIKTSIDKISTKKSFESLNESNIVLILIDINQGITKQDLNIIKYTKNIGKPSIVIINKSDLANKKTLLETENKLKLKNISIGQTTYNFISAKYGFGIKKLMNKILFISNTQIVQFKQKNIENIVKKILKENTKTKNIQLYYIKIIKYEPLTIKIIINKDKMPKPNEKYILNSLAKNLKIENIPIKVIIKKIRRNK